MHSAERTSSRSVPSPLLAARWTAILAAVLVSWATRTSVASPDRELPERPAILLHDLTPLRRLDLRDPAARRTVWDTCHVVAALQGLANRSGPRVYVRWIEPWDSHWLDWLRSPGHWLEGRDVERVPDLESLLRKLRSDYEGVVLYPERPASLAAVASTVAGAESLLPVRIDERPGSLYRRIVAEGLRLPVRVDLSRVEFPDAAVSAKCAPYVWARRRYLETGRCDPHWLAYYIDAFWLADPFRGNHENHTLSNHDFFIARKAFFFDLHPWGDEPPNDDPGQPTGLDETTLKGILRAAWDALPERTIIYVGGFVPWAWKYTSHASGSSRHPPVATEWRYAEILSCFDAIMDADALGPCAMANASFYSHYPLSERYPQPPDPTDGELRRAGLVDDAGLVRAGAYISFYVGDYDSAAWLYREFPRCWNDPARGQVPLGWALNPNLELRAPMALAWARETRTPLDIFTTGDSGAGYLNPGGLAAPRRHSGLPSGVEVWERFCLPFYRRWDLRVTGFIIDGHSPAMTDEVWDVYRRVSPGGIVGQKMPPQGVRKGLPFLRMSDGSGSPQDVAARFAAMTSPERRSFYYVRTILQTAGWHRRFADELEKLQPAAKVVDPHTFFALLERYETNRSRYPKPRWTKDVVSWRPGTPDGLRVIPFVDGPVREETIDGRKATVSRVRDRAVYIYLSVHDGFPIDRPEELVAEVTYHDRGENRFRVEYNGEASAYQGSEWVVFDGRGSWRTARIRLPAARLSNQQNAACDLRLVNERGALAVSRVVIRRPPPATSPSDTAAGGQGSGKQ